MKEIAVKRFALVLALCLTALSSLFAQNPTVPEIPFDSVPDFLKLPPDIYLGETAGVAVNSKGHIFVFSRGNSTGPAYGAAAAQLLEFAPDGTYLREIGHNLYAWSFAHAVRIDPQDNIWVTDKGSDMVIKFNPAGRVTMVFGRKQEASDEGTAPLKHVHPPLPPVDGQFRQVTDIAWDPAGNTFISDGYINSRVAKVDKNGKWLKSFGEPGDKPGQFNTPAQHRRRREGKHLRSRSRQPPHPGLRQRRQIPPPDHHRRPVRLRQRNTRHRQKTRPRRHRSTSARLSLGALHHARPHPGPLRLRRLPWPHLQTQSRRPSSRRPGRIRQTTQAIRLDPRDRLPLRERPLRRRTPQLARPETRPAPKKINRLTYSPPKPSPRPSRPASLR